MEMSIELSEFEPGLTKALDKIAAKSGDKQVGMITSAQAKALWRAIRVPVAKEAIRRAPASGKKGEYLWTAGGGKWYPAKHGAFKTMTAYRVSPWKSGEGAWFSLGGGRSKYGTMTNVIGKFRTFGCKPSKSSGSSLVATLHKYEAANPWYRTKRKAAKGQEYPWLLDAVRAVGPFAGRQYVKLLEKAIQVEIEKGVRRR